MGVFVCSVALGRRQLPGQFLLAKTSRQLSSTELSLLIRLMTSTELDYDGHDANHIVIV